MTTQIQTMPRLDPHLIYWADAFVSATMGVTLIVLAESLTQLAGWTIPASFLWITGLLLLPWAAFNAFVARTARPSRSVIRGNITVDLTWVIGTAVLVAMHAASLTPVGFALLIGQGIAVAGVAAIKLIGVRDLA